jgi:hypothetical protein
MFSFSAGCQGQSLRTATNKFKRPPEPAMVPAVFYFPGVERFSLPALRFAFSVASTSLRKILYVFRR